MTVYVINLAETHIDEYSDREIAEAALSKYGVEKNLVKIIEGEELELEYVAKLK